MGYNFFQVLMIFFVSSIIGMGSILDEFQFHRPLIACALIGFLLGDLKTGVIVGGTLEMIVLGWMNVGAAVSPDTALASIISTILIINGNQGINTGIALAIPIAAAGQVLTIFIRTISIFFQHSADKAALNLNFKKLNMLHLFALMLQALRVSIPSVIVFLCVRTSEVKIFLNAIPKVITNGLNIAGGVVMVVGYAMVINMMKTGYLMPFLFLGFIISSFSKINLVSLGIVGIAIAILYIQLNPKYYLDNEKNNLSSIKRNNSLDNELD